MEATATAEPQAEERQESRDERNFISKTDNLRLVVKPQRTRLNAQTGEPEVLPGKTIEFVNGSYRTSDPEEIKFLENHNGNGGPDGFHELGQEPDAAAPDPSETVRAIIRKANEGDFDGITAIYLSERNTYSRPAILAACEEALKVAEEDVPAPHPEPGHQVPRVRVGPETGANVPQATEENTEPVGPEADRVGGAPEPEGEPPSESGQQSPWRQQ